MDSKKDLSKIVKPTDKEMYEENIRKILEENTDPTEIYKKHVENQRLKVLQEELDAAILLQDHLNRCRDKNI